MGYFDPKPCHDCGKELPYGVHQAGDFLYGGGTLYLSEVAENIECSLKDRANEDARREQDNQRYNTRIFKPITNREIAERALLSLYSGFEDEDLVAAVQHWGDMGDPDGSECERLQDAAWCHEPTPNHGGWDDKRPRECTLEAHHDGDHRFEHEPVTR